MSNFLIKAPLFLVGLLFVSIPLSVAGGDFAAIFLILFFFVALAQKKTTFEFNFLAKAILLFIIGFIISSLMSTNPVLSFAYTKKFWKFLLPFAIFWALKDKDLKMPLKWLVGSSIAISIYALVQYQTGLDVLRSASLQAEYIKYHGAWLAVGAFSHHLTFGGVCLLLMGLFSGLASVKSDHQKYYILTALLNLLAVFASHGRSVWLGTAITLGVIAFFRLSRPVVLGLGLLGLVFIVGLNQTKKSDFVQQFPIGQRLASALSQKSNIDRLYMWEAGIDMIKDRPLFGFGASTNKEMLPYYKAVSLRHEIHHKHKEKHIPEYKQEFFPLPNIMHTHRYVFQHEPSMGVHNLYLQSWVNFGFLGFVGLLLWLLSPPFLLLKSYLAEKATNKELCLTSGLKLGIAAGLLGSFFAGIFENNFRDAEVQTAILTCHGLALLLLAQKHRKHDSN